MAELLVDSEERRKKAEKVLNILKFIPKSDTFISNCDQDSDISSELPNPFSDDEKSISNEDISIENAKKVKRMSKLETDIFLMQSFSKEFRQIEDECKQKLSTDNENICSEDLSQSFNMNSINDDHENPQVLAKVNEILSQCGLDAWKARKELENPKKNPGANKRDGPPSRTTKKQQQQDFDYEEFETNSLSGIWRMLDGQSVENGFPITEIGYNLLDDQRLNWLIRDEISWDEKEKVNKKCEQWIKKCRL